MKTIYVTQFLRPNGRQEEISAQCSDAAAAKADEIEANGLRLTAEVLSTGHVSFAIENKEYGDFDIIIVANGPKSVAKFEEMLLRFDVNKYAEWLGQQQLQEN